jgi:hypothetical protein
MYVLFNVFVLLYCVVYVLLYCVVLLYSVALSFFVCTRAGLLSPGANPIAVILLLLLLL